MTDFFKLGQKSSAATSYSFPLTASPTLPASVAAYIPLSYASFVPSSSSSTSREPGLLVVSTLGYIQFWDAISLSFSGVERFKSAQAAVNDGELIRSLVQYNPSTFLLATSHARIFAVILQPSGGKVSVNIQALETTKGWGGTVGSAVWSAVFGSRSADPRAGIIALALQPAGQRDSEGSLVYAVTDTTVQVWKLSTAPNTFSERSVAELDHLGLVLTALGFKGEGSPVKTNNAVLHQAQCDVVDATVAQ